MGEIKLKLYDLRKEKKASQNDLAKVLGVTRQAYSRYELGDHELGYESLIKLAQFFDVSIDYLLGNSSYYYPDSIKQTTIPTISPDECELLECYRSLTEKYKDVALGTIRGLAGQTQTTKKENYNTKKN